MAKRIIKKYDDRKNEILNAAEKLFFERGYDTTPVEAIIDSAKISKGTFYYYFKSKEELLDTLATERAQRAFENIDAQIFNNDLSAPDRMKLYFDLAKSWKFENRAMLKALIRILYAPANLLLREKFLQRQIRIGTPTLTRIVKQGVTEGCYHTSFPDDIAGALFSLLNSFSNASIELILSIEEHPENIEALVHKSKVFQNIFERILGASEGSIEFADSAYLNHYFSNNTKGHECE